MKKPARKSSLRDVMAVYRSDHVFIGEGETVDKAFKNLQESYYDSYGEHIEGRRLNDIMFFDTERLEVKFVISVGAIEKGGACEGN